MGQNRRTARRAFPLDPRLTQETNLYVGTEKARVC